MGRRVTRAGSSVVRHPLGTTQETGTGKPAGKRTKSIPGVTSRGEWEQDGNNKSNGNDKQTKKGFPGAIRPVGMGTGQERIDGNG